MIKQLEHFTFDPIDQKSVNNLLGNKLNEIISHLNSQEKPANTVKRSMRCMLCDGWFKSVYPQNICGRCATKEVEPNSISSNTDASPCTRCIMDGGCSCKCDCHG